MIFGSKIHSLLYEVRRGKAMSVADHRHPRSDERLTNPAASPGEKVSGVNGVNTENTEDIWDILPLSDLYKLVLEIYRKVKDQVKMDYHQRVMLLAYYKQEKYGVYSPEKDTNTGYFDLVGSDRRKRWKSLGNLSKEDAQREFIKILQTISGGKLREWIEQKREEKRMQEQIKIFQMVQQKIDSGEIPVHMLQAAGANLNSVLANSKCSGDVADGAANIQSVAELLKRAELSNGGNTILSASLWCKPNAAREFIEETKDGKETKLTVGRGETVTVRVGTSDDAFAIFWEFVTANYDIGFGLSFIPEPSSPDEKPTEVELLPVTRRDCSVDVVMGNHQYCTKGTYLLKFDNSYSLLRSKDVYYKVYYHKPTL